MINNNKTSVYTHVEREEILNCILTSLKTDERIAGVLIVGSGAVGFDDEYSDIDLSVVVADDNNVHPVFCDYGETIEKLLSIIGHFEVKYGVHSYLHGFLTDNFLEIDIGFVCLSELTARKGRWNVAFDRSGRIEEIMQSSWEKRPQKDIKGIYLYRINSIWHHIIHVVIALKRNQPWKALHYLERVRNQTFELAGLRMGLEVDNFRQVDPMPEDFLSGLKQTLVISLDANEIMRALRLALKSFFYEAQNLDDMLGLDVAGKLKSKMTEFINLF
jgi:predicted nucleotidyltransferase